MTALDSEEVVQSIPKRHALWSVQTSHPNELLGFAANALQNLGADALPQDSHLSGFRLLQSQETTQQRRFSRSIGADQCHHLSSRNVQIHAPQHLRRPEGDPEGADLKGEAARMELDVRHGYFNAVRRTRRFVRMPSS